MNKLLLWVPTILLIGCSNVNKIEYKQVNDGCVYSEIRRPRKYLTDFFGRHDYELSVTYTGITCQELTQHELKNNIHKKPYNSIEVFNEMPTLEIDINQD